MMITGVEYSGKAIYISSSTEDGSPHFIFKNVEAKNIDTFLYYTLDNENTTIAFSNCKLKNDYIEDTNQGVVFNIMGTFSSMILTNFNSVNARKFIYTSSVMDGQINLDSLFIYNNEAVYDLNNVSGTVSLTGVHTYLGSAKDTKYTIFENI